MKTKIVCCPDCMGDGMETCHNPDHGFISALSFREESRLGCPVCGHDPDHKAGGGHLCPECGGLGMVHLEDAERFCDENDLDIEELELEENL